MLDVHSCIVYTQCMPDLVLRGLSDRMVRAVRAAAATKGMPVKRWCTTVFSWELWGLANEPGRDGGGEGGVRGIVESKTAAEVSVRGVGGEAAHAKVDAKGGQPEIAAVRVQSPGHGRLTLEQFLELSPSERLRAQREGRAPGR